MISTVSPVTGSVDGQPLVGQLHHRAETGLVHASCDATEVVEVVGADAQANE